MNGKEFTRNRSPTKGSYSLPNGILPAFLAFECPHVADRRHIRPRLRPNCSLRAYIFRSTPPPLQFFDHYPRPLLSSNRIPSYPCLNFFGFRILSSRDQSSRRTKNRFEANDGEGYKREKVQITYPCNPRIIIRIF